MECINSAVVSSKGGGPLCSLDCDPSSRSLSVKVSAQGTIHFWVFAILISLWVFATSLLCVMWELERGGCVAVAFGVSAR